MQRAFMNEITIKTFLRPTASAMEPQKYAPTIIPKKKVIYHRDKREIKRGEGGVRTNEYNAI